MVKTVTSFLIAQIMTLSCFTRPVLAQEALFRHDAQLIQVLNENDEAQVSACKDLLGSLADSNASRIGDLKIKCKAEITAAEAEIASIKKQISSTKTKRSAKKFLAISAASIAVIALVAGYAADVMNNINLATGRVSYSQAEQMGALIAGPRYKLGLAGAAVSTTMFILIKIDSVTLAKLAVKLEGTLQMLGAQKASLDALTAKEDGTTNSN